MDKQALKNGWPITQPPFITSDLKGIGGEIKLEPAHFLVEEIPLYEPEGEGPHLYLRLTREGWTTRMVQNELAGLFKVPKEEIGLAGLKDKQARVTQTFSLPDPGLREQETARLLADTPFEFHWARLHRNKLKRGHLLGNRFEIVVADTEPEALPLAGRIAKSLAERGLPNFFGTQRFGAAGDNAQRGRRLLSGRGNRKSWLGRLLLSAYQSFLFNAWLEERMARGWFQELLVGDIAKKLDTGGLFSVEDATVETKRLLAGEITHTGPIYGYRTRLAGGKPGELEDQILTASGLGDKELKRAGLKGSRRPARLLAPEVLVEEHNLGLKLSFALPKGSYATTLLREFMKKEPALPEE